MAINGLSGLCELPNEKIYVNYFMDNNYKLMEFCIEIAPDKSPAVKS